MEEQEQKLAKEIERRKHQELKDEKVNKDTQSNSIWLRYWRQVRQRIREESDEIKALELKLKTAYLNKERAAQVEERQILEERKKVNIEKLRQRQHMYLFCVFRKMKLEC